jgi:hypothetical protein
VLHNSICKKLQTCSLERVRKVGTLHLYVPFHFVHIFITFATVVEEALKKGGSTSQLQAHLFCARINVDGALVGQVREALIGRGGQKMQKFTSPRDGIRTA